MKYRDFDNYDVTEEGKIFNIKYNRQLHPTLDGSGYEQVKLYKEGIYCSLKVHKIVWESFVGEVPKGMEIDHKNGIKTDNRLRNLRCVTHIENCTNPITYAKFIDAINSKEYLEKRKINANKRKGIKLSEEIKRKMSESRKGICPSKHALDKAKEIHQKTIYQYELDTNTLIRIYYPLNEVEKFGFSRCCVWRAATGKIKQYKGYRWSYKPL